MPHTLLEVFFYILQVNCVNINFDNCYVGLYDNFKRILKNQCSSES